VRLLVETRPEGVEGVRTGDEQRAIKQRILRRTAGCLEHEVGLGLSGEFRWRVDQPPIVRLDPGIERIAPSGWLRVGHRSIRRCRCRALPNAAPMRQMVEVERSFGINGASG
jgi:hypothetical protein